MVGPQTHEQWRWGEALALEKLHGDHTPRFIAERIAALELVGDAGGVERLYEIAAMIE